MKALVVAVPWQNHRDVLHAVVETATVHGWDLTVQSDLVAVPVWARKNYAKYDPAAPLPSCGLLIWLSQDPLPEVPWALTVGPVPTSRWSGTPARALWSRTDGRWRGHVLSPDDPVAFFQALAKGHGGWPAGTWTGPVLPGRLCTVGWWSRGGWKVRGVLGVEHVNKVLETRNGVPYGTSVL